MSLAKLPKWNVRKTTFTYCVFIYANVQIFGANILQTYEVFGVIHLYQSANNLNINQLQMQAGPGSKQIPTDTKLSYLHKDFHAEYRKVQHKGMIDERRSWCKNYGYLHHHFFYPEGRAIIGGASSSNMLTGYILFTQASQGTSWDIITGVYVMVPCCPMSLWTILTPKPAGTFVIFSVFGCESSPISCNVR